MVISMILRASTNGNKDVAMWDTINDEYKRNTGGRQGNKTEALLLYKGSKA